MIKKLKNYLKTGTLLFGITLLLWNCEQENDLDIKPQTPTYNVVHTNFNFIAQNKLLLNKVSSLSKKKDNSASKGNTINADDFTIFTDRVTYISPTDGSKESYSFYIERNSGTQTNKIENLILSKKTGESQYSAHIITYFFPDGLTGEHDNFEIMNFEEIDAESVSGLYAKSIGCENTYEYNVVETEHECYSGDHSGAGEIGNCNYENDGGTPPYSTWAIHVTVNYVCNGDGTEGGGTPGGDPTSDPGALPNPNPPANPNNVDTGITLPPNCQGNDCDGEIVANEINTLLNNTLNGAQLLWLFNNDIEANLINEFLGESPTTEQQNFSIAVIDAYLNDGEVDLDDRLIYNPIIAQDYRAKMSDAEEVIFDTLNNITQALYLKAATQAYIYAETHFPRPVRNRKGDAFKHTFWNALSTVYIGEALTEQLTTAHEDINYDPNYPNHYKETQMDLHNNAQGRQIAYGAGRLYQLVQDALDNGDLRYLDNLEFVDGFWRATNASQLTPTNQ